MRVDHELDRVGNQVAAGQRVQHAVVAHGDAVIDGDGVEFLGDAARRFDLAGDELAQVFEVNVAGHELREGVDDGNDGLVKVAVFHAGGTPERARTGHVAASSGSLGAVNRHGKPSW